MFVYFAISQSTQIYKYVQFVQARMEGEMLKS